MFGNKWKFYVDDISTLEVSSIVVNSITGRKMPEVTAAFVEIISAWIFQVEKLFDDLKIESYNFFKNLKYEYDSKENEQKEFFNALKQWNKEKCDIFNKFVVENASIQSFYTRIKNDKFKTILDYQAFGCMYKKIAKKITYRSNKDYYISELFRLVRIQTRISCLIDQFNSVKETPQAQFELRKLWEIKCGFIYAQSCMQLDGDIITRFNKELLGDKQTKDITIKLLNFHKNNVDISLNNWQFIVKTVVEVIKVVNSGIISLIKPI